MNAFFTMGNLAGNQLPATLKLFLKAQRLGFCGQGFINQKVTEELPPKGLHLETGIRNNMKTSW